MSVKSFVRDMLPEAMEIRVQVIDHYWRGEPELRALKQLCDRSRPAIDVGANIGTYTYFLQRYASRVVAFEPNPQLASRLRRIFPTVDVREKAVSDSLCTMDLFVPVFADRMMHELGSITQEYTSAQSVERHRVSVVSMDSEGFDDVGFIKIDVEQNEVAVLRGACETIARCRPIIMTEVAPLIYEDGLVETFQFLCDMDYEGWFTFEGKKQPFSQFSPRKHANREYYGIKGFMNPNVLFLPRERDAEARVWRNS